MPFNKIFTFFLLLENVQWREVASGTHLMKGGKIGHFPRLDAKVIPRGDFNLYNPFPCKGIAVMTEEQDKWLIAEIKNGCRIFVIVNESFHITRET